MENRIQRISDDERPVHEHLLPSSNWLYIAHTLTQAVTTVEPWRAF
jgi:hypothetical protein